MRYLYISGPKIIAASLVFVFQTFWFTVSKVAAQNIAINTTGNPAAAGNLFEVTQAGAAGTVGIFSSHTGVGASAYAIWAEATGATSKYALVVPDGKGYVGIGTTTPSWPLDLAYTVSSAAMNARGATFKPTFDNSGDGPGGLASQPTFSPSANLSVAYGLIGIGVANPAAGITISNVNSGHFRFDTKAGSAGAVTNANVIQVAPPSISGVTPTNIYGINIANQGLAGMTTSYGLYVAAQSGATNSYAGIFNGGNVGIGTATPTSLLNAVFTQNSAVTPQVVFTNNGTGHSSVLGLNAGSTGNPGLLYQVGGVNKGAISWDITGNYVGALNLTYSGTTFSTRLNNDGSFTFHDAANGTERSRFNPGGSMRLIGPNGRFYFEYGSMDAGQSGIASGYGTTYNGTPMTNSGFFQAETQGTGYRNLLLNPIGGNIGIGLTSPTLNTSGKVLHLHEPSTAASVIHITNSTTGSAAANGFVIGRWNDGSYGNGILLWNYASTPITFATGSVERMFIDGTTGNVGIGTTAPSTLLHLRSGTPRISFTDTDQPVSATNPHWIVRGQDDGYFRIQNTPDFATITNRMVIDATGNVGIGTNTPTSKLHVAGQIDVSSNKIVNVANPTTSQDAATLAYVEQRICEATGGLWSAGVCSPYIQVTAGAVTWSGANIFNQCQTEFGTGYVPANPYQALALANIYTVPNTTYYWVWPGGTSAQVTLNYALKRDCCGIPSVGQDICPAGSHVAIFHNWDSNHADSWDCTADGTSLRVICVRRN